MWLRTIFHITTSERRCGALRGVEAGPGVHGAFNFSWETGRCIYDYLVSVEENKKSKDDRGLQPLRSSTTFQLFAALDAAPSAEPPPPQRARRRHILTPVLE